MPLFVYAFLCFPVHLLPFLPVYLLILPPIAIDDADIRARFAQIDFLDREVEIGALPVGDAPFAGIVRGECVDWLIELFQLLREIPDTELDAHERQIQLIERKSPRA